MRKTTWMIPIVLAAAGQAAEAPAKDLGLKIEPSRIEMGLFYSGVQVKVHGVIRPGSRVAVLVSGKNQVEVFNRKVKKGPIWVTSGKVKVSGVPPLFLRFTDGMLREFLAREYIDHYQMDQAALQRQIELDPDQEHDTMVASWLSLKAAEGTYRLVRDGVRWGRPEADGVAFHIAFEWPRKAAPAEYRVMAFECRDRAIEGIQATTLPVVRVGFPAWLADMAKQKSLLYGVIATVSAAAFGFAVDFLVALIFGKKAATAH